MNCLLSFRILCQRHSTERLRQVTSLNFILQHTIEFAQKESATHLCSVGMRIACHRSASISGTKAAYSPMDVRFWQLEEKFLRWM